MTKKIISFFIVLEIVCSFCFAKKKQKTVVSSNQLAFSANSDAESDISMPLYTLKTPEGDAVAFDEIWGYVSQTQPEKYNSSIPLTDVCFFAAEINCYGELDGIPKRSTLDTGSARCHLVIICESRSLSHFSIDPDYDVRKKLLNQIVKAAAPYDGVVIDLEYIPTRDRNHFITFIADLRYKLKGKQLSVCVPARFKKLSEDIYPYSEIARYCDRVFVMSYDEHWSTSKPGPIASVDWCKQVLDYAISSVPEKKLVIGMPFYGRTWADRPINTAWSNNGLKEQLIQNRVSDITYENHIPTIKYKTEVEITCYFNDNYATHNLCKMYKQSGVSKVGFWRIGQEDEDFWKYITTENR